MQGYREAPPITGHASFLPWRSDDAVEQGVEADEAEHNGASQLNSGVRRTIGGERDGGTVWNLRR
jgi:hypothetical protein